MQKGFISQSSFRKRFLCKQKGFFSVVILVIVVLLLLFFVGISANTKPIMFSDLPRHSVLVSEEAYSLLDKKLSSIYILYEKGPGAPCQTTESDVEKFKNFLLPKDLLDSLSICDSEILTADIAFKSDTNSLDANITAEIICNTKNEIESYTYSKTFIFHKNYKSVPVGGNKCNYTLKDLDAEFIYYHN